MPMLCTFNGDTLRTAGQVGQMYRGRTVRRTLKLIILTTNDYKKII